MRSRPAAGSGLCASPSEMRFRDKPPSDAIWGSTHARPSDGNRARARRRAAARAPRLHRGEWFPHEYVPWGRARDFVSREEWWDPADTAESAARSALFVNLLTEDNLPYYFRTLSGLRARRRLGRVDPALDRRGGPPRDRDPRLPHGHAGDRSGRARAGRMQQVSTGVTPELSDLCEALCYTTLQELATRIAHRNTGNLLEDPAGRSIMARVSNDENLHYLFYRDLASAAIEVDPSGDGDRDGPHGAGLHDARHRHPRLRPARAPHRSRRASTTTASSSRRCCSR